MKLLSGYRFSNYFPSRYNHTYNQYWPHFLQKVKQPILDLPRTIKIKSKICLSFCIDSLINFLPFKEIKKERKEDFTREETKYDYLLFIDEDLALFEDDI